MSEGVATYISERGVKSVGEAAALADDYFLIQTSRNGAGPYEARASRQFEDKSSRVSGDSEKVCNYCHKRGHWKNDCYALKSRPKQAFPRANPVMCAASVTDQELAGITGEGNSELKSYLPFITEGVVSLVGSKEQVRIKILRDTGAFDSFIAAATLPFSNDTFLGSSVPVVGMGLKVLNVPQHKMMLHCDLFQGEVSVGVRPALPMDGVAMILGNDIAGDKVWADVSPPARVTVTPLVCSKPDESEVHFPDVFRACAVTRSKRVDGDHSESVASSPRLLLPVVPWSVSHDELMHEQKVDSTLKSCMGGVCSPEEVRNRSCCYFLHNNVLMRKWTPQFEGFIGDPIYQVVVPLKYRNIVLQISHDQSGHMGVRKTYDRVLLYFFWPRLKRDVAAYSKSCHTCQLTSKPNQVLKAVPLCPIPAISQPFEHLIIDCVGPLPPSKSGSRYLLTVMCQSTRYPAAYPLRSITSKSVVRALSQFISIFGVPRVIQSDQGSNFCSKLFAQVLEQLNIVHNLASAYHAQSQGVLERFHQTLKSMLRSLCVQMQGDWEEALPWMLLAAREVIQESTGFSPNDLIFGHKVRGPLALLQDNWKEAQPPSNLLDFVNGFRYRLYMSQEVAKKNLARAQAKMKERYDCRTERREFLPGDQVLALLPIVTSPWQARFSGPFSVLKKLSDQNYLISTPARRTKARLCHVNLLKPYVSRASFGSEGEVELSEARPVCLAMPSSSVVLEVEDLTGPDEVMFSGRLRNKEALDKLESVLGHLESGQRVQLVKLIRSFSCLFGDTPSRTTLLKHDIDVGGAKPIRQRFYRVHPEKRKNLEDEIRYMLHNGIAVPSDSSWASPCLLVPKPDNTPRFCTDFRKVNAVTKPDSFPLPRMEDCVDQVGGAKFVTKLDLLKGYWQVPLTDRAREIASFITPGGLYSYNVMAFGLRNAPATFQRLMNLVVRDLEGCAVYLDDVVVYADNWEQHLGRVQALFMRLAHASLTVNLAKCEFARATVVYLGRVVGQGSVRPVRAKVCAIDDIPTPTTKKELMRFLGMVGYYRCFCRNFSTVVAPLTDLLKGKTKYVWSPVCQQSFERVKALISNAPVLVAPRWDREFCLEVDASMVGAGAVLLQKDDEGINKPVCFFSRKFNCHQRNYSVIEKETLALILALQHFSVYLGSGPVVVFSDHNPLTFLSTLQTPNQRLMRWALHLQSYTLDIRHIKGRDNVVADALSRSPMCWVRYAA